MSGLELLLLITSLNANITSMDMPLDRSLIFPNILLRVISFPYHRVSSIDCKRRLLVHLLVKYSMRLYDSLKKMAKLFTKVNNVAADKGDFNASDTTKLRT